MKKKTYTVIAFIFVALTFLCCFIFDNIFPKAEPIFVPNISNTISLTITDHNKNKVVIPKTDFETFLIHLNNAKPKRKMSVNDSPTVKNYYKIEITEKDNSSFYFIYKQNSQVYIEMPYIGIYRTNKDFFNFILKYY